jgi:hypothetical protein
MPPERQFVTLSEALTWIAFGVSMDGDQLHEVLSQERFGEHDSQKAIKNAVRLLTEIGSGGKIVLWGKHQSRQHDDEEKLLTRVIEPVLLADYRQFSYLDDELRHGEGFPFGRDADGTVFDQILGAGRKDSFVQVRVNRAQLLHEFPRKEPAPSERERFLCGHTFKRDDPATITPWWSVNQALAWIATRIPSYVEYVGNLEEHEPREHRPYFVQAICESQVAESDEGMAFLECRRASWPTGTLLAHAGRALLEKIQAEAVRPATSEKGKGRPMLWHEFVGVGTRETGSDWLDLDPQPLFSSAEVIGAFPIEDVPSAVPVLAVTSTAGAENECRDWLEKQFAADPKKTLTKTDFRTAALGAFPGRVSQRGFDLRVWPGLAQQHGRDGPGAKRKS